VDKLELRQEQELEENLASKLDERLE